MKKGIFILTLCLLLCLCALPAMAQEQSLPVIRITYAADAALSSEEAVEAQVVIEQSGQDVAFDALLRLYDQTTDVAEKELPQQSLRIDSDTMRFVLYNAGNDALFTKVMGAVCSNLLAQSSLAIAMPAQEPVEVYLNGEYWGLYSQCEVLEDAIARIEGIDDTASLNVARGTQQTICGDISSLKEDFQRIAALDLSKEEDQSVLNELLDVESFLDWMAANVYLGNSNLFSEVFFYQEGSGPWKCAARGFSFALFMAQNNTIESLVKDEALSAHSDIVSLSAAMLEEPTYRNLFLTKLGELYQTLTTPVMQATVDAENARIASALPSHAERWADEFAQVWEESGYAVSGAQEALLFQQYRIYRLRDKTLLRRPWYVYDSVQSALEVSDEDMALYFGGASPELPDVPDDTWEDYKEANSSLLSSDK